MIEPAVKSAVVALCQPPKKQLERTVIRGHVRWTVRRAANQLRR